MCSKDYFAILLSGIVMLLAGCERLQPDTGLSRMSVGDYVVGKTVGERPIQSIVLGDGKVVILVIAVIHGDEQSGTFLVTRLSSLLTMYPSMISGKKIVLIPVANPDGMVSAKRYNENGVDLNRNFEAENREDSEVNGMSAVSEPESEVLYRLIQQYQPVRILSIHLPLGCIDYDGPAQEIAEAMGKYCDLPVKKVGARPGSLGSYAGVTLGIPIVTMELKEEDRKLNQDDLWERYEKALQAFIVFPEEPRY